MIDIPMMDIRRAGKRIGNIRAEHVATPDRARYELAALMGVHAPSVLRGHVTFYSDGSMHVWPIDSKGRKLGRPYGFTPYTFTTGEQPQ